MRHLSKSELEQLVADGRAGVAFVDIGSQFDMGHETTRKQWYNYSSKADRKVRDKALLEVRKDREAEERERKIAKANAVNDHSMPPGLGFSDDLAAAAPDYGRVPLPETFVPTASPTDWAVIP